MLGIVQPLKNRTEMRVSDRKIYDVPASKPSFTTPSYA